MTQAKTTSERSVLQAESRLPIFSYHPVTLPVEGRPVDLQMKVSAPASGDNLPVIILSHGHGRSNFLSSLHGYAPLVDFLAAQGFVVIQPTHLNSKTLALPIGPEGITFWKSRPKDIQFILDNLQRIIAVVPGLTERVNSNNVAAVGHSLGGHTVAMLAGMEVTDGATGEKVNFAEPRLKARVMIGLPGGSEGLNETGRKLFGNPLSGTDFSTMTLPALVINGDRDKNPNFSDIENWRADAYHHSPAPKSLLTVFDGEHIFGGISGYDVSETTDENPDRVTFLSMAIIAYLRSAFDEADTSWEAVKHELQNSPDAKGSIESK
ncbi:alpha/beta hydrolase family protein [Pseudocnuella soli]|uniref:alpha/beta hydrolase family protein n=1 Tax=Pseudocnuella soli TaxID=2502779 RepID=UPI00104E5678|nr:chlorophyllase [Pseudocnuella soli]